MMAEAPCTVQLAGLMTVSGRWSHEKPMWQNVKDAAGSVKVTYGLIVWVDQGGGKVGYYALSAHRVAREKAATKIGRGGPADIPAVLLARLALSRSLRGQGLGAALVADALQRIVDVSGIDTEWCIEGQHVPASALFIADADERSIYDAALCISPYYRNLILLSTLGPPRTAFTVVSGNDDDITDHLKSAVIAAATSAAQAVGVNADAETLVVRKDRQGQNVKDAAAGASITYGVIGWGVLVLAALALLVMQTSHVRQRMRFYGLMQSLGASSKRIAALLLIDGAVIIVAGVAVALGVLWLGSGTIRDFAMSAFGVDAHVLLGALIPRLAVGIVLILGIATAAPLAMALRRDPLEVLEAPRD